MAAIGTFNSRPLDGSAKPRIKFRLKPNRVTSGQNLSTPGQDSSRSDRDMSTSIQNPSAYEHVHAHVYMNGHEHVCDGRFDFTSHSEKGADVSFLTNPEIDARKQASETIVPCRSVSKSMTSLLCQSRHCRHMMPTAPCQHLSSSQTAQHMQSQTKRPNRYAIHRSHC